MCLTVGSGVQLEALRDDLELYYKLLKAAMVEAHQQGLRRLCQPVDEPGNPGLAALPQRAHTGAGHFLPPVTFILDSSESFRNLLVIFPQKLEGIANLINKTKLS